jgi:two-component system response regulator NreC
VVSARRLLQRDRPSVLLLDAVASPVRALSVLPIIKRLSPATSVILIGRSATSTEVPLEGVRRGASGYLSVDDLARDLPKAVHTVMRGEPWLPRRLGAAIVAELRAAPAASS